MDSEEETMEIGGTYGDEDEIESIEDEGQDQEVPQAPSPLEYDGESRREEEGGVLFVSRLDENEVNENRFDAEVEMVNRIAEQEEEEELVESRQQELEQDEEERRLEQYDEEQHIEQHEEREVKPPEEQTQEKDMEDNQSNGGRDPEQEVFTVPDQTQSASSEKDSEDSYDDESNKNVNTSIEDMEVASVDEAMNVNSSIDKVADNIVQEDYSEDTSGTETEIKLDDADDSEDSKVEEKQMDTENELKTEPVTTKMKQSVAEIHPGVFEETPLPQSECGEKSGDILDSLPALEKLRGISRASSFRDDASVTEAPSDTGDAVSEKDSIPAQSTRNLRRKETRKTSQPPPKRSSHSSNRGRNGTGVSKATRSTRGKGTGRRNLTKKKPVKAPPATEQPTLITSNKVYFEGQYFQVGDIVSVTDSQDDDIYYAQLRGFLTDQFAEKSCVITWLLPTTDSPPPNEGFHPATYILGPEEDAPRKLEVFTFVMHAPDDYFYNRKAPYRTLTQPSGSSYTSIRLGPRLRKTVDNKSIYVGIY